MVRLFITLDAPSPKRWILNGIVTGLAMLSTAVWIVEHQVDLLGTGGMTGVIGVGIISFFKFCGQSEIDALDAALPGKLVIPPEMTATLREIHKSA